LAIRRFWNTVVHMTTLRGLIRFLLAAVFAAGVFLSPGRAWAPPICHGTLFKVEQLTLQVRRVTVDGAPGPVATQAFHLLAGCPPDTLTGAVVDPDPNVVNGWRQTLWVRQP